MVWASEGLGDWIGAWVQVESLGLGMRSLGLV